MEESKNVLFEDLMSNVKMIEDKLEELIKLEEKSEKKKSPNNKKVVTNVEKIESKLKELIEKDNVEIEEEVADKILEYTAELRLFDLDKEIMDNVEKIEARLKELVEVEEQDTNDDVSVMEDSFDIEEENVERISMAVTIGIVVACSIIGSVIGYLLYMIAMA